MNLSHLTDDELEARAYLSDDPLVWELNHRLQAAMDAAAVARAEVDDTEQRLGDRLDTLEEQLTDREDDVQRLVDFLWNEVDAAGVPERIRQTANRLAKEVQPWKE